MAAEAVVGEGEAAGEGGTAVARFGPFCLPSAATAGRPVYPLLGGLPAPVRFPTRPAGTGPRRRARPGGPSFRDRAVEPTSLRGARFCADVVSPFFFFRR